MFSELFYRVELLIVLFLEFPNNVHIIWFIWAILNGHIRSSEVIWEPFMETQTQEQFALWICSSRMFQNCEKETEKGGLEIVLDFRQNISVGSKKMFANEMFGVVKFLRLPKRSKFLRTWVECFFFHLYDFWSFKNPISYGPYEVPISLSAT